MVVESFRLCLESLALSPSSCSLKLATLAADIRPVDEKNSIYKQHLLEISSMDLTPLYVFSLVVYESPEKGSCLSTN